MESRVASCSRVTKETQIEMTLNLDGTGKTDLSTGIGFFDHMLSGFARHGLFDLTVKVAGDLEVDSHTRSRIPESCWGRPLQKHWEIKKESSGMDILCFRWMRCWCFRQSTFPEDHI